jgi:hypothetical protein
MTRPTFNRDIAGEISQSLEKYDRQTLINLLSHLLKTYVIEGTMPFNLPLPEKDFAQDVVEKAKEEFTFAKLIEQIKKRLPKLQELKHFNIEEGKVTLLVENLKVTFGEKITSEFVPVRVPHAAAAAPKTQAPAAPGEQKKGEAKKAKPLSEKEQEALHDIMQRFKRLELD